MVVFIFMYFLFIKSSERNPIAGKCRDEVRYLDFRIPNMDEFQGVPFLWERILPRLRLVLLRYAVFHLEDLVGSEAGTEQGTAFTLLSYQPCIHHNR